MGRIVAKIVNQTEEVKKQQQQQPQKPTINWTYSQNLIETLLEGEIGNQIYHQIISHINH